MRLDALGLRAQARRGHLIVDDLALEGGHVGERLGLTGVADLVDRCPGQLHQGRASFGPVAGDVQHQPTPFAGRGLYRQTSELLEGLQHPAIRAHQPSRHPTFVGVDDGHRSTVSVDVDVDVTIEVGDVQQPLQEICGDLSFALQLCHPPGPAGTARRGNRVVVAFDVVAFVVLRVVLVAFLALVFLRVVLVAFVAFGVVGLVLVTLVLVDLVGVPDVIVLGVVRRLGGGRGVRLFDRLTSLGHLPEVTTVLLAGNALALVAAATELAHALAPAIVVMEDVDLIAEHRTMHVGPQPLLFTLLDAMDGLASEADVAFVLTTNRADLLETALSQRPGRIDLAVEIPLPDAPIRRRLLDLYAAGLPFSTEALDDAAVRCGGVTASFFKELTRRSVLIAADAGVPVGDDVLDAAVQEMLGDSERFTRAVLGGESHPDPSRGPWGGGPGGGHPAGSGSSGRVRRLRRGFTTYGPE
jgi:hypothetical protein